jgi:hypothetical protein
MGLQSGTWGSVVDGPFVVERFSGLRIVGGKRGLGNPRIRGDASRTNGGRMSLASLQDARIPRASGSGGVASLNHRLQAFIPAGMMGSDVISRGTLVRFRVVSLRSTTGYRISSLPG